MGSIGPVPSIGGVWNMSVSTVADSFACVAIRVESATEPCFIVRAEHAEDPATVGAFTSDLATVNALDSAKKGPCRTSALGRATFGGAGAVAIVGSLCAINADDGDPDDVAALDSAAINASDLATIDAPNLASTEDVGSGVIGELGPGATGVFGFVIAGVIGSTAVDTLCLAGSRSLDLSDTATFDSIVASVLMAVGCVAGGLGSPTVDAPDVISVEEMTLGTIRVIGFATLNPVCTGADTALAK
ncbi:hypothetical protein THASP1DRAFT_30341 [Thamnocephalis sphaerospora]|uniref:Uncharacterized protein n=1 Tax=Thamnocephalis sphaerospora TaxID=78915 RepID=A0A4P9XPB7_9FUNG|nr:hypothetical protein THASP1DRAFT_30341 [Thamnocephalis sphaerospora]|eukprot:RKP07843.1 hypothetical protein THASP1DRAFT_30341 [Thamnocephalis sphaerospora]